MIWKHATHRIGALVLLLLTTIFMGCFGGGASVDAGRPSRVDTTTDDIGTSVGGRNITALVMAAMGKGNGADGGVLVLAGIRGNEPAGPMLARQLAGHLQADDDFPENRKIVIVPEVNPDGIFQKSRFNLDGKDINRDFTSARPQPETQAVIGAIDTYLPNLIISLRQLDTPGIDYDGPGAEGIARDLSAMGILDINKWGASYGSIGYFAGLKKNIPVITLGLHRSSDSSGDSAVWDRYGGLLMTAINISGSEAVAPQPVSRASKKAAPTRKNIESPKSTDPVPTKKTAPVEPPPTSELPEPPPRGDSEVNHYHEGLKLFEAGDYAAARRQFEIHQQQRACEDCPALISDSEKAEGAMAAGIGYLDSGRLTEALSEFNTVRSLNPRDRQLTEYLYTSHYRLAENQFSKGDYPAARENYEAAVGYNRNCSDCRTRIAQCDHAEEILRKGKAYFDSGDYPRAIIEFEEIIALNPGMRAVGGYLYEAYLRRGKKAFGEGNYSDAESDFMAARRYNPDCGDCGDLIAKCRDMVKWRERGVAYFDQGKYAEAVESMEAAAAINPRDPTVRECLYKSHFQLGRYFSEKKETLAAAIKHYEASLEYNDICSKCQKIIRELIVSTRAEFNAYHYQQGKTFFLEGRKDSLERALKEWAMVDPDYKDVKTLEETARRLLENTAQ